MSFQAVSPWAFFALVLGFGQGPATAQTQDEIMEYQRCVMRCAADASGTEDPAYAACIRDVCDGGIPAETPAGGAGTAGPAWSFSAHPVIGSSAHVDAGGGGIGYGCGVDSNRVTVMVDNALFKSDHLVVIVDDFATAFTVDRQAGAASRKEDAACFIGLPSVAAGSTLYLAPGRIEAITSADGGTYTIRQDDRTVEVRQGENIIERLGAVALPLRGSSRAIESLLRGCPLVRADLADNCGV